LNKYDTASAELRSIIEECLAAARDYQTLSKSGQTLLSTRFFKVNVPSLHDLNHGWESGFSTTEAAHSQMQANRRKGI